jgi:hypothetical protein
LQVLPLRSATTQRRLHPLSGQVPPDPIRATGVI